MKKLLSFAIAAALSLMLFTSCGSGTSLAIGALRLDNEPINLFRFTEILSYDETVTYTDVEGSPLFTANYYFETAEDAKYSYNVVETIGDYRLYAYEGKVYAETEKGMTAVLLLRGGTYLDFTKRYLDADFILDGDTHLQRNAKTENDVTVAEYETVLTPQQTARASELGVEDGDKIVSVYRVRGPYIESVAYSIEKDGQQIPVAKREIKVSNEKIDHFASVKALPTETVTINMIFTDGKTQGQSFEVPTGVYVGFEIGDYDYTFYLDAECTTVYRFDESPVTETLTLYVSEK